MVTIDVLGIEKKEQQKVRTKISELSRKASYSGVLMISFIQSDSMNKQGASCFLLRVYVDQWNASLRNFLKILKETSYTVQIINALCASGEERKKKNKKGEGGIRKKHIATKRR